VPTRQRASAASLVRRLEAAHRRNQELSREVAELRDQLAAAYCELRAVRRRPEDSSVVDLSQRQLQDG
jgi:cell division protein FtsB